MRYRPFARDREEWPGEETPLMGEVVIDDDVRLLPNTSSARRSYSHYFQRMFRYEFLVLFLLFR